MSALVPLPITPPPGVVVTESNRVAEGRWTAPFDRIRFVKGRAQKIGGNIRVTATPMSGTPRALHAWRDFLQNQYVASGTYRKLYAFDSSYLLNDITPIVASGSFGTDPIATVVGLSVITVTQNGHGRNVGDTVIYAGLTATGGIAAGVLNGTFTVVTITNSNAYTVDVGVVASSTATGGGSGGTYQYEIPVGTELGAYGQGWGVGQWGLSTWGTPRASSTVFYEPRVWSLDHFGKILLATYNGGSLWSFDPTQALPWGRALSTFGGTPMNSPSDFRAMFVTPERFVFGLCDAMVVKVCSQADVTAWTPGSANTAFQRTLQEGNKLIGGKMLAPFISLVWSDSALYLFQYTGSQFIYNSSLAGKDCGLISPNGAVTVDGVAYWMGNDNFYMYNGTVGPLPNVEDIRKYVFDAVPSTLAFQCSAVYVPKYREVWFFYPTTGDVNPTRYVIYHINDQCWSIGTAQFYSSAGVIAGRASGTHFTQGDTSPLMASTDGYIHNHDAVGDTFNDNGAPQPWQLTLAPYAMQEGLSSLLVESVLLDFFEQSGDISVTVNGWDRLTDLTVADTRTQIVPDTDAGLTDFRVAGRYLGLSMSGNALNGYMRYGKPVAFVKPTGRRS